MEIAKRRSNQLLFRGSLLLLSLIFFSNCGRSTTLGGLWSGIKQLGNSTASIQGNQIAVDSQQRVYITGTTTGGLDGNTLSGAGATDLFLSQYNASGDRQWTKQLGPGAGSTVTVSGIAVDSTNGFVYVSGKVVGGTLGGVAAKGTSDSYIAQYKMDGTLQWTVRDGLSSKNTVGSGVAVDSAGRVCVTGKTDADLDGNTHSADDFFLLCYSKAGVKDWTRLMPAASTKFIQGQAIAIDSSNNIIVTGIANCSVGSQTYSGGSNQDIFIVQYTSTGTRNWVKQVGGTGDGTSQGVAVDSSGNIYVSGNTNASTFDSLSAVGSRDAYLVKYDTAGTKQWSKRFGASSGTLFGSSVAVDSLNRVVVAGKAPNTAFDGNTLVGTVDFYWARFGSDGTKLLTAQYGVASKSVQDPSIAIDIAGNIFIGGNIDGAFPGNTFGGGSTDFFIAKYNSLGVRQ